MKTSFKFTNINYQIELIFLFFRLIENKIKNSI